MSDAKLLDGSGAPVSRQDLDSRWSGVVAPKGSHPFFGWTDLAGDPVTVRVDAIAALTRDARNGQYVVILQNSVASPYLRDVDALRLMKRLGWSVEKNA